MRHCASIAADMRHCASIAADYTPLRQHVLHITNRLFE